MKLLKPFSMSDQFARDGFDMKTNISDHHDMSLDAFTSKGYYPIGASQSYGEICIPAVGSRYIRASGLSKSGDIKIDTRNMTVEVCANVTISSLLNKLESAGYYLKVVPGSADATVGGCVSADVHGKSSFRYGVFSNYIEQIRLFNFAARTVIILNRNDELFRLTVAGYGATGLILGVKLRIFIKPGNSFELKSERACDLKTIVNLMRVKSNEFETSAVWFSVQASKTYAKLIMGRWCEREVKNSTPMFLSKYIFKSLGFFRWRRKIHCLLAWYIHAKKEPRYVTQFDMHFPLSTVKGWQYMFGESFIERQFLIKFERCDSFVDELEELMRQCRVNSPFCAIKFFNETGVGVMNFVRPGVSFNIIHSPSELGFIGGINSLMVKYDAVEYLAKSKFGVSTFPRGYDNYLKWLKVQEVNSTMSLYVESSRANVSR
jgi:decaprenylphospho-beta-D-ribofuranose 2-oxidase